jgi:hypothetical protein
MGENSASDVSALRALCEFEKTDVGATLMGKQIRVDESGEFISVSDAIAAIEGCTSNAAKLRMNKLVNDENMSEGANSELKKFKYDTYR